MTMLFDSVRAAVAPSSVSGGLGALPQWRLEDLYESMESPRFADDLERAPARGEGVRRELSRQAGARSRTRPRPASGSSRRCGLRSAAGPDRAASCPTRRCFTPATRAIPRARSSTATRRRASRRSCRRSPLLRARAQPPRRLPARRGDDDAGARPLPSLARRHPQGEPHQLADEIEQLFLEKSVTGVAAWNRLFDETMSPPAVSDFEGESLTLEPLLGKLQDPDETKREAAAQSLAATLGANLRLFTLVTNTLAKDKEDLRSLAQVRGHRRFAPPGQSGRTRGRRRARHRGDRSLSAPLASLLRA